MMNFFYIIPIVVFSLDIQSNNSFDPRSKRQLRTQDSSDRNHEGIPQDWVCWDDDPNNPTSSITMNIGVFVDVPSVEEVRNKLIKLGTGASKENVRDKVERIVNSMSYWTSLKLFEDFNIRLSVKELLIEGYNDINITNPTCEGSNWIERETAFLIWMEKHRAKTTFAKYIFLSPCGPASGGRNYGRACKGSLVSSTASAVQFATDGYQMHAILRHEMYHALNGDHLSNEKYSRGNGKSRVMNRNNDMCDFIRESLNDDGMVGQDKCWTRIHLSSIGEGCAKTADCEYGYQFVTCEDRKCKKFIDAKIHVELKDGINQCHWKPTYCAKASGEDCAKVYAKCMGDCMKAKFANDLRLGPIYKDRMSWDQGQHRNYCAKFPKNAEDAEEFYAFAFAAFAYYPFALHVKACQSAKVDCDSGLQDILNLWAKDFATEKGISTSKVTKAPTIRGKPTSSTPRSTTKKPPRRTGSGNTGKKEEDRYAFCPKYKSKCNEEPYKTKWCRGTCGGKF